MRKPISVIILVCLLIKANGQVDLLTKSQVLRLPCKILKSQKGDYVAGYYNQSDSSLYNCSCVFIKTLPGGYAPVDTFSCANVHARKLPKGACPIDYLSSITFDVGSIKLNDEAKYTLQDAAARVKANGLCGIKVVGYYPDGATQKGRQLNWDRLNTVVNYLIDKQHVAVANILFNYDEQGSANTLDLYPSSINTADTVVVHNAKPKPQK
jgi:hypothetical protein